MIIQQRPASEKCININGGTQLFHVPPSDIVVFLPYYYIPPPPSTRLFFPVSEFEIQPRPAVFTLHKVLDSSLVPYQVGPHPTRRSADHASRGKMHVGALKGGL